MKLKIRQPDLISSTEIKQLPSKQVFLFTLKKTSKQFLIPVKLQLVVIEQENLNIQRVDAFTRDPYYKDIESKIEYLYNLERSQIIINSNLSSSAIDKEEI
jgi:hypothetical protein